MRDVYAEQLDEIRDDLVRLARLVRVSVSRSAAALLDGDIAVATKVVAGDGTIDALRDRIEGRSIEVLTLQNPVAGDLRMLVGTLRIVGDLERIGDLAAHVAKVARMRGPSGAVPNTMAPVIRRMAALAELMVGRAEHVIAESDLVAARELEEIDEEMDRLRRDIFRTLLSSEWTHGIETAVDVALLGRYFERIADHAVSVARRVLFMATGEQPLRV